MLLPGDSDLVMPVRVMPQDADPRGFAQAGAMLRWLDFAMAMSAMRHARSRVVTVSVDRMDFHRPTPVDYAQHYKCRVNWTGRSSLEVGVRVEAENLATGEMFHAATAYATFVSMGEDGKPASVAALDLASPERQRRFGEALKRRELRKAERAQARKGTADPSGAPLPTWEPGGRTPSASRLAMPARVMAADANPAGNAHGGVILRHMERAAAMAAERHCGGRAAIAWVERVEFVAPGHVDDVLTFDAVVNRVWGDRLDVGVRVSAGNLATGEERHAASGFLVYRALDVSGAPCPAPPLNLETPEDLRRFQEAAARNTARDDERGRERAEQEALECAGA